MVAAIALCGAPLALGLVHLPVILAVSALGWVALCLLLVGRAGKPLRLGWLSFALLGVCAAMAFQLLPLPFGLVRLLAPKSAALMELTLGAAPGWRPLTLDVGATSAALFKSLGWTAVAMVLQHRSLTTSDGRRRVRWMVVGATAAVAVLGLGHFLAGEKRSFLGLYEFRSQHHFRSSFGNANHLAGYLTLGGLLSLGLALHARVWRERVAFGAVFLIASMGALLSASRGGFGAWLGGLLLLPMIGWGASSRRGRDASGRPANGTATGTEASDWRSWLTLGGATALVSLLAAWIYVEFPRVLREIQTLFALSSEDEAGKVEAAQTAWEAAKAHWLFGIGRGAYESVGTHYQTRPFARIWFTHAENEPLQALAELGLPVGVALVAAFAVAWLGIAVRGRRSWAEAGVACGMLALALQNLVDFGLQGAAGLAFVALAAGPGGRVIALGWRPAMAGAAAGALLLLACGWAAWPGLDVENELLVEATEGKSTEEVEAAVLRALRRRPADWVPVDRMSTHLLWEVGDPAAALPWINRRLLLFPQDGHGQVLAGEALAMLGRDRQARLAYRAAADLGVSTIDRVVELWPTSEAILEAAPREPGRADHAARRLSRGKRQEDALAVVEGALTRHPDDLPLRKTQQALHLQLGDLEEALRLAQALRLEEPGMAGSFTREAAALRRLGRVEEARALYGEGMGVVGVVPSLVFEWASLELGAKRWGPALEVLERLPITSDTGLRLRYHRMRAQAFQQQRSFVRARDELRLALRLAPTDEGLRINLADVLGELGEFEESRKELDRLAPDGPKVVAARKRWEDRRRRYQEERGLDLERLLR